MVDLKEAEKFSVGLMEQHGLIALGWTFRFDKATSRLGACHYHKKEISLSRLMVMYGTREDVEQTMLHEIAHALLPREAGHYKPWKVLAASIGYTGERCGRNPYVEAQLAGIADGPIAKKMREAAEYRREELLRAQKKAHAEMLERIRRDRLKAPVKIFTHVKDKLTGPSAKVKTRVDITIGATLILPGGDTGKVESKGSKVWRVRSASTGKLYAVPFQHAQMVAA